MSDFDHLPPEAMKALHDFLTKKINQPGRIRLMAEKFDKFGPTLTSLASCVHPLIFETGIEGADYGIAGSCFLARYKGQLFVITANHCLSAANGNDVRIALNPETKSFLPLNQLHRAESKPANQDYADFAVFEAAAENLEPKEQEFLNALDLDSFHAANIKIQADARLVIPGFPKCLNSVDYDRFVLHMQRYLPSGKYRGLVGRAGIHRMEFDELEQIDWPDGMSGSPILFVENLPDGHCVGFLGMLIKAHRYQKNAEFIGADVVFYLLDEIIKSNAVSNIDSKATRK